MFTEKYGKQTSYAEEFQGYSKPNTDRSKMDKLRYDECRYITTFETPQGDIKL